MRTGFSLSMATEPNVIVEGCLQRMRRWPRPLNWAYADWWEEVAAQAQAAAWKAVGDYDASKGVPLGAFVHLRIRASTLTRYRQEWAYALHCAPALNAEADDQMAEISPDSTAAHEFLAEALAQLPAPDRRLIEQLFLEGRTEAEVARHERITQQAVSKRKRAIVKELRVWLDPANENQNCAAVGCKKGGSSH